MKKTHSVLVIDDSYTNFYMIKRAFKKDNVFSNFFYKENGKEGLEFLKSYLKEYYEHQAVYGEEYLALLVLLDINMPAMNGFEFLDKYDNLSKTDKSKIANIVMYSTSDSKSDINRALNYDNVLDYVVKPMENENLTSIFTKYIH